MKFIKTNGLGIILCVGISAIATILSKQCISGFSMEVIGAPVFSIIIGMIITLMNPQLSVNKRFMSGIKFTSKKVLQWAVIILGFSLNISTIANVGVKSVPVIISTISISLITAMIMMKLLHINKKVACLIGVGSSICGGSAIAATAPVIDADDETVAQSISVIFLFNVLAALIFPTLGHYIGLGTEGFAVFAGTAVNDTSSVTAVATTADGMYGCDGILSAAVTVKLTRTLAIIPITLILALIRTRNAKQNGANVESYSFKSIFPWFILYFIIAALVTTIIAILPENNFTLIYNNDFISATKWLAKFFIAMAMSAIGINTDIIQLIKNGGKPILMGLSCWIMITLMSITVQMITGVFYTNI